MEEGECAGSQSPLAQSLSLKHGEHGLLDALSVIPVRIASAVCWKNFTSRSSQFKDSWVKVLESHPSGSRMLSLLTGSFLV